MDEEASRSNRKESESESSDPWRENGVDSRKKTGKGGSLALL